MNRGRSRLRTKGRSLHAGVVGSTFSTIIANGRLIVVVKPSQSALRSRNSSEPGLDQRSRGEALAPPVRCSIVLSFSAALSPASPASNGSNEGTCQVFVSGRAGLFLFLETLASWDAYGSCCQMDSDPLASARTCEPYKTSLRQSAPRFERTLNPEGFAFFASYRECNSLATVGLYQMTLTDSHLSKGSKGRKRAQPSGLLWAGLGRPTGLTPASQAREGA